MISAMFWFGWLNLFQAEQVRDAVRRWMKASGVPFWFELPVLAMRIVGAFGVVAAVTAASALFSMMLTMQSLSR